MIVIQNTETRKYLAPPGSQRAYTRKLEEAQRFRSREEANQERCVENERVVEFNAP